MPIAKRFRRHVLLSLVLLPVFAVGCNGGSKKSKIVFTNFPDWYTPDLKTVAILPFGDRSGTGAGMRIGDKVSAELTRNTTYEVYTRANLRDVLAEKDLIDAGIIEADKAMEIGRVKSVQAIICGVCNRYDATTKSETRFQQVPITGYDANGNPVITGYNNVPYLFTRNEAVVDCQVVVIDTQNGRQLAAIAEPSLLWSEGSPPKYAPRQLLEGAEADQVGRIMHAIAVTRVEVKMKGFVLKVAEDNRDGKWKSASKLAGDFGKFFIVVRLPPEADRNHFRLVVMPKEGREPIAEKPFVWDKNQDPTMNGVGFDLDTNQIYQRGGAGKYEAKLYSGRDPEPIAKEPFTLEPARGEKGRKDERKRPPEDA